MANVASVFSLADEHRARAESSHWLRFVTPSGRQEFIASWLALLAARIERVGAAFVLVADASGTFTIAAAWPDPQRDLQYLGAVARRALEQREGVTQGPDGEAPQADGPVQVGYPVTVDERLCGAVVLDLQGGPHGDLQQVLRQVHWSVGWLADHFRTEILREREQALRRSSALNELMATALQHARLQPSAFAVANELAQRLGCDRVAIGFEDHGSVVPLALSHTASFEPRSDLVRHIAAAMDEVLDLGVPVAVPRATDDELGAIAHAESARALGVQAMLSVPLVHLSQTIGVITLERSAGPAFDLSEQALAIAAGTLLGPAWALQRTNDRPAWRRALDGLRAGAVQVAGPRHPGWKLVAVLAAALVATLCLVQVEYRVSARTVIEGATQLASVAPFEGYIAESAVRAGDTVRRGQLMARLDDRDLQLERGRWGSEREQLQRRLQVAMAQADRGAMVVLAAQVAQAEAQLGLAEDKLARARLLAPFDGVVVSGDLSRLIGTPVEQGKLLFEVAPLEGYRVVLQVDDRDIARVAVGQGGELVLSGLPDKVLPFTLTTVMPVSMPQDGRNVFRVEASVHPGPGAERLRPGMEGVGKVSVGERSLAWIWTHGFVDWLRVALWNWMP